MGSCVGKTEVRQKRAKARIDATPLPTELISDFKAAYATPKGTFFSP